MKNPAAVFFEKFDYQSQNLNHKTVLITAGITGIGCITGQLLASLGAHVMIFGQHEQELNAALKAIREIKIADSSIIGIQADISKIADIKRVFREVDTQFNKLDILINNVTLPYQDPLGTGNEEWQYEADANLLGHMSCVREAVGRMKAAGEGHIVNIGSTHKDGDLIHAAAKYAIQGFSESLGREVNAMGIKVTLIEPGLVGTSSEEKLKVLRSEDIAACVHYTLTQPKRCAVTSVQIKPHLQGT